MEEQKVRKVAELVATLGAGALERFVGDKEKAQRTRYQQRTGNLVNIVLNVKNIERLVSKRFFRMGLNIYLLAHSIRYWARVSTGIVEEYFFADNEYQEISERKRKLDSAFTDGSSLDEGLLESVPEEFREAARDAMTEALKPKYEEISSTLQQQLDAVNNYRKAIEESWGILYPDKSFQEALERRVRQSRG